MKGWAQLNMFSFEKRRFRGNLIEYSNIFKRLTSVDTNKLFSFDDSPQMRSNGIKLRCRQIQLDYIKIIFSNDVVRG